MRNVDKQNLRVTFLEQSGADNPTSDSKEIFSG
nr:Uncharacterised protein [Streptococcus thermophilus]